jgi:hypothetical protein
VSPAFSHWRSVEELTFSIRETSEMRKERLLPSATDVSPDDLDGVVFMGSNDQRLKTMFVAASGTESNGIM